MGRLASATKLGVDASVTMSVRPVDSCLRVASWRDQWHIFRRSGPAFESEAWCRLDDLQQAMHRQDLSIIVAVTLAPAWRFQPTLICFASERLDLELANDAARPNTTQSLQKDYGPVRWSGLARRSAGLRRRRVCWFERHVWFAVVGRVSRIGDAANGRIRAPRHVFVSLTSGKFTAGCVSQLVGSVDLALVFVNGMRQFGSRWEPFRIADRQRRPS